MAESPSTADSLHHYPETIIPWSGSILGTEKDPKQVDYGDDDSVLSALCVPGSRLVRTGFSHSDCSDNLVLFVNAGGEALMDNRSFGLRVEPDRFFEGGDIIRTDEAIEGSDIPSIYQSARFGNFSYRFENLSPGDYFVDLHFAEIVYTNGPKGMRVFDVFMQEEKVLSEIDIYSIVGANKALQLVDVRVSVGEDGAIVIRFEGVNGSPIVGGISIKQAARLPALKVIHGCIVCNNCAAEIEISSAQDKNMRMQFTAKYEKKIEELKTRCQLKTDECHEAWMLLTSANKQLQDVTMEVDNKLYEIHGLGQAKEETEAKLRDISGRYEHDKRLWTALVDKLERKVKSIKQEYSQLYCEVHKCADAIPELNNMASAVQAMVAQCDDLKLKLSEEQAKRKILSNQIQEANEKGETCLNLQKKVKELEEKLKEREHVDSMILQNKVKDLDKKLKERMQGFERHSAVLQLKVQELEKKLTMEQKNKGPQFLQQKVKELEEKLRQKEQEHALSTVSAEKSGDTPNEPKTWSRGETIGDIGPLSLRRLSYGNQMTNQESALLKGTHSLRELSRRRGFQSNGPENNFMLSATLADRKILSAEPNKEKPGDHKALARITRSIKPATTAQKALPNNPVYRDQVPAVKPKTWFR